VGNFLEGGGIAVTLDEAGNEFEDFLLPPGDRHGGIIANKKRIGTTGVPFPIREGWGGLSCNGRRVGEFSRMCFSFGREGEIVGVGRRKCGC
jgi:hypothetical protein